MPTSNTPQNRETYPNVHSSSDSKVLPHYRFRRGDTYIITAQEFTSPEKNPQPTTNNIREIAHTEALD